MKTLSNNLKNAILGVATASVLATGVYVYNNINSVNEKSYAASMISAAKKYVEGNEIAIDTSITTNMSLLKKLGYVDKKINSRCVENSSVTVTNENGTYVYVPNLSCEKTVVDVDIDESSVAYVPNDGVVGNVLSYNESYSAKKFTNGNVEVSIEMSEPILDVTNDGWTLSSNNTTLTKVFSSNDEENLTVYSSQSNLPATINVGIDNIDKTSPIITVNNEENKEYYTNSVTVTIDEANLVSTTLNGSALTSNTIELTKEGKYIFEVIDAAGNVSNETVVLDWTAPKINRIEDGKSYNDNPLIITYSEGHGILTGDNLETSLDFVSGGAIYDDGNYTLTVTDDAGNSTSVSFIVDKTVPTVTFDADGTMISVSKDETYYFNDKVKVLNVLFEDKLSSVSATLNGEEFISGTTLFKEGEYELVAKDAAGNTFSVNFIIDKTAPIIEGVEQDGIYKAAKTVKFGKDKGTLINNDTKEEVSISSPYSILEEGNYTLVVVDNANNKSSVSFIIDLTKPVFNGIEENTVYGTDLLIDVDDKLDVTIKDNGKEIKNGTTISSHGSHTLVAIDAAGNKTQITVIIDKEKPVISAVEEGKVYNTDVVPVISDDTTVTATLNKDAYTIGTPISESGAYTLIVKDAAGNTSMVSFVIDKIAPTVFFDADGEITKAEEGKLYYFNKKIEKLIVNFEDEHSNISATLNGQSFRGGEVSQDGEYELIVKDAVNSKVIKFIIDRQPPMVNGVEEGKIYKNQVSISYNEGTAYLNEKELTESTINVEGKHKLTVKDAAGNITTVNFVIDKSNPVGSLIIEDKNLTITEDMGVIYTNKPVQIEFSDKYSKVSAVLIRDDDRSIIKSGDTVSEDGNYVVTITDDLGFSISANFIIDTEDPIAEIIHSESKETLKNKAYGEDLKLSVKDNNSVKNVTLDGNAFVNESVVSREGEHTLKITDIAGNEKVYTFFIDKTVPTLSVESGGNVETITDFSIVKYYNSMVKISFSDSLSNVSATDENGSIINGTEYTEDGKYQITVKDAAGNTVVFKFEIDGILKNGKFTYSPVVESGKYTNKNILVSYIPSENDVTILESGWKKDGDKFVLENEISDNLTGTITVIDKAGNKITETYVVDNIDKEVPKVFIIVGEKEEEITDFDSLKYYNKAIKFRFEDVSGTTAKIQLFDGEVEEYTGQEITKNGQYSLIVSDNVIDENKNTVIYKFGLDKVAPKKVSISQSPSVQDEEWTNQNVTLTLEVDEPAISYNAASSKVVAIDADENGYATKFQVVVKKNGVFAFKVQDALGNKRAIKAEVTNIDKDKPTLNGVENKKVYANGVSISFEDATSPAKALLQKDGGDIKTYTEGFTINEAGKYVLTIVDGTYKNEEDTSYNSITYTFTIDNEIPEVYLVSSEETLINQSNTADAPVFYTKTVKFKYSDRLSTVKATLNGENYKNNKSISANGVYVLVVSDNLGNKIEHHFVIDSVGPQQVGDFVITPNPKEVEWTNQNVTVTLEVDEPAISYNDKSSGVVAIDADENGYATKFQVTVKKNGIFKFKVKDQHGNKSVISVEITHIDKTKPNVTIENITQSTYDWTKGTIILTLTADEPIRSTNSSSFKPTPENGYSEIVTVTIKKNGPFVFKIVDRAGNKVTLPAYTVSNIDKEVPRVFAIIDDTEEEITDLSTTKYFGEKVKFRFEDASGATATIGSDSYDGGKVSDGKYTMVVKDSIIEDDKNQVTFDFVVDTEAPTIKVEVDGKEDTVENFENIIYYNKPVKVTVSDLTNVTITDNGETIENEKTFSNGSHEIVATDELGHSVTFKFIVDTELLAGTFEYVPIIDDGKYTNKNITVTYVPSEKVTISEEGWELKDGKYILTSPITENTTGTITVTDKAGNTITETYVVNYIDKINPTLFIKVGDTESVEITDFSKQGSYNKSVSFTFNGTISAGTATIQKDGESVNPYTGAILNEDGSYTITVTDQADNSVTYKFVIDTKVKQGTFEYSVPNGSYTNSAVTVTYVPGEEVTISEEGWELKEDKYILTSPITENMTGTLTVTDKVGNTITETYVVNNIDKVDPLLYITVGDGTEELVTDFEVIKYYNKAVKFRFEDAISSATAVLKKNEEADVAFTSGTVISEDGEYTLVVSDGVIDENKNTITYKFVIDTIAPTEKDVNVKNGAYYAHDIILETTAEKVILNGEEHVIGTPITEEKVHRLVLIDKAGNKSSTIYFGIDKTKPAVSINGTEVTESEEIIYFDEAVSVEATDLTSMKSYISTNDVEEIYALGTTYNVEGIHTLRVVDQVGNTTTIKFAIDTVAPIIEGIVDGAYYNQSVNPTFNEGKGKLVKDGEDLGDFTSGSLIEADGEYTLTVVDNANNSVSVSFTIDTIAPTGKITSSIEDSKFTKGPITLTFTPDETVKITETGWTVNESAYILIVTENGTYSVRFEDNAGNNTVLTYEVSNIDKEVPRVFAIIGDTEEEITDFSTTKYYSEKVKFRFEDASGATATIGSDSYDGGKVSDGKYTMVVKDSIIEDDKNQVTFDFVVDTEAPTIKVEVDGKEDTVENFENIIYYNKPVKVTVSDLTNVTITDNGETIENEKTFSNGSHEIVATDELGHSVTFKFIVDAELLAGTFEYSVSAGSYTNSAVTVTYVPSEDVTITEEGWELKDGKYILTTPITENTTGTITVTDKAGNTLTETYIVNNIDKEDPLLYITVGDGTGEKIEDFDIIKYYNKSVKFRFEDSISSATAVLKKNDEAGVTFTSGTVISEDGEYTLVVSDNVIDEDKNTITYKFVIDTIAPTAKDTNIKNGAFYPHDIILETGAAKAILNGEEHVIGTPITEEKVHRLVLIDEAGNKSSTIYFGIDKTKPVVSINGTELTEGEDVVYFDAAITIDAKDLTKMKAYIITDDVEEPFTLGSSYSGEGIHILKVVDKVGNTSTINFAIDTIDPIIDGVVDGEYYNHSVSPTFNEGVGTLVKDGKDLGTYISGTSIDKDGVYTLTVVDNAKRSTSVTFTIDTIAPNGTITSSVEDSKFTKGPITLTFKPDEVVIVKTESWNESGAVYILEVTENGEYSIRFEDQAGNSTLLTYKVNNIDREVPRVFAIIDDTEEEITDLSTTKYFGEKVKFRFEDASGATATIGSDSYDGGKVSDGKYTMVVKDSIIEDDKNQVTFDFVVDTEAPTIKVEVDGKEDTVENFENIIYYNKPVKVTVSDLTNVTITDNGDTVENSKTYSNGSHTLVATDELGHCITFRFEIDTELLAGTFEYAPVVEDGKYTNQDVTVTYVPSEDITITEEGWELKDGKYILTTPITENTTGTITVTDKAGNTLTETYTVNNIDKEDPLLYITVGNGTEEKIEDFDAVEYYRDSVKFRFDGTISSGSATLQKDSGEASEYIGITISDNGSYTIVVTDKAGNSVSYSFIIDTLVLSGRFEYSVPAGSYTNSAVTVTYVPGEEVTISEEGWELKDGKYILTTPITENTTGTITVTDKAGNTLTETYIVNNIDKEDPLLYITVGDGTEEKIEDFDIIKYYNKSVKFRFEDSISSATAVLKKNDEAGVTFTSGTVISEDGEYTLVVSDNVIDEDKNTITYKFVIDTIAPTEDDVNVKNGTFYPNDIVLKTSAIKVILNGEEHVIGTPITEEKVHRLVLIDEAGNQSSTIHFGIDKTKPVVSINGTELTEGEDVVYFDAAITIDAKDLTTMKAYIITDDVEESFTLGSTYSGEGIHTLKVIDIVGHETIINFAIDTIDPIIDGVVDGEYYNHSVSPTFNEGVGTLVKDGKDLGTYVSGTSIDKDGVYTLTVVDNAKRSTSVTFTIDTIAPIINGIDKIYYNKPVKVLVDEKNIKYIKVNDHPATYGEYSQDGTYNVVAEDKAGNISKATFVIDTVKPNLYLVTDSGKIKIEESSNTTFYNNDVKFYYEDAVLIDIATLNGNNYQQNVVVSSGKDQVIVVKDKAGNYVSHKFTIDTDLPTTNIVDGKVYNKDIVVNVSDASTSVYATLDGNEFTGGNVSAEGVHTLKMVDEAGNTSTVTFTIDKTAPILSVIDYTGTRHTSDFTAANIEVGDTFVPFGYDVTDNLDSQIKNKVTVVNKVNTSKVGAYTVTYTAKDAAGWTTKIVVTVKVVDTTKPTITLNQADQNPQYVDLGAEYVELGAKATDNYDGELDVKISGSVDTTKAGNYYIKYNATDSSGNKAAVVSRLVVVKPVSIKDMFITGNSCTEGTDCYNTQETDNYIWYSGYLWRVVKVNSDGTVKMITESPISAFAYHKNSSGFTGSYIEQWLNSTFYNSLKNASTVVKTGTYCSQTSSKFNLARTTCSTSSKVSSKVGLLTIDEYNILGGSNSFLNTGDLYYTMTPSSEDTMWLVMPDGTTARKYYVHEPYSIRPVITVDTVNLVSGEGTLNNPYRIENDNSGKYNELLTKRNTGEYVNYSGFTWRVVSTSSAGTKLILDSYLKDVNGEYVEVPFGTVGIFSTTSGVGQYLNTDFYNRLEQAPLVKNRWYYNSYGLGNNPFETSLVDSGNYTDAYVGLIRIGDLMSSNSFSNRIGLKYSSWVINSNVTKTWYNTWVGVADYGDPAGTRQVKPVVVLNTNVKIKSGNGTYTNPYELNY